MKVSITRAFRLINISENYNLTCKECKKVFKRTVSDCYTEGTSVENIMKIRDDLKKDAVELSEDNNFICNKCCKNKITKSNINKIDITNHILFDRLSSFKEASKFLNESKKELSALLKDKVVLYNSIEYVVDYLIEDNCDMRAWCTKVSISSPWKLTDYSNSKNRLSIDLLDPLLIVTDENFKNRNKTIAL